MTRSIRIRHAFLAAGAVFLALALACSRTTGTGALWHQVDLLASPPDSGEVRESRLETRQGRYLPALRIAAGQEASWRLVLGAEPRFSFRPAPDTADCSFLVAARTGRGEKPLHVASYEPAELNLNETVYVDLKGVAGEEVDLVLGVQGGDGCRHADWASPLLMDRRPLEARPKAKRPNIVLLGIDTLRADALGVYGRDPSPSPAIDRLAEESDVYLDAFSSSNNTNPSFVSMMTGLYPKNHGIYDLSTPLPKSATTLAELLQEAGYATRAVVSVGHLANRSGLRQGFDELVGTETQLFAETVVTTAIDGLQEMDSPFFLWLHLFDAHLPHTPPAPYHLGYRSGEPAGVGPVSSWVTFREPGPQEFLSWGKGEKKKTLPAHRNLYPGEIAYLDRQIGRLLAFLKSRGLYEETVIVLIADHGETLGERRMFFNHTWLYDNTTHVPLMIRWPGATTGRRIAGLVQHFDVFPTLLAVAGVEVPPQDGRDLRTIAADGRGRPVVFGENALGSGWMVRTHKHKLLVLDKPDTQGIYLYNLKHDPEEKRNLAGKDRPAEKRLLALLERWKADQRSFEVPLPAEIGEEEMKRLRALGYVR